MELGIGEQIRYICYCGFGNYHWQEFLEHYNPCYMEQTVAIHGHILLSAVNGYKKCKYCGINIGILLPNFICWKSIGICAQKGIKNVSTLN